MPGTGHGIGHTRGVEVNRALHQQPHLLPAIEGAVASYHLGTAQHSTRVARMAEAVGWHLGLRGTELEGMSWAGVLHDVGKLAVPESILAKDGPLSELEWAEVRRHPAVGADLLLVLSPRLEPIARAVRAHHERWDGAGYPDGLAGDAIPLAGRILTVADVYDSVTHTRSYRRHVFSPAEATAMVEADAGTRFDPAVVAAFLELHRSGRFVA